MPSDSRFIVRRATNKDIANIAAFNIQMAMETEAMVLQPEIITGGVTDMINHPEWGFYLVVEVPEQHNRASIIASLMVTTEWSDWRNGMFWWIQSVYVQPQWRRKGLYRRLYLEVKKLAAAADNVCGFRLYVEQENEVAQETYRSLGMQRTHYQLFEELCETTSR